MTGDGEWAHTTGDEVGVLRKHVAVGDQQVRIAKILLGGGLVGHSFVQFDLTPLFSWIPTQIWLYKCV